MSNRETDGEAPLTVEVLNEQPVGSEFITDFVPDQKPNPEIFKLHAVACDDLFEYLSLEDLCAIGATCKRFNRLAGLYFQQNFGNVQTRLQIRDNNAKVYSSCDVDISVFSHFVQTIVLGCKREAFQYMESNCSSLKKVVILDRGDGLSITEIDCLKDTLAKVEYVELFDRGNDNEASESLLKLCTNMKSLNLSHTSLSNNWFIQKHPLLEHPPFPFISIDNLNIDLKTFLEENPKIFCLAIGADLLMNKGRSLMKTDTTLDELYVMIDYNQDLTSMFTLLNDLSRRHFFKSLSLGFSRLNQEDADMLAKICAIERISWFEIDEDFDWPVMANLKKVNFDARRNIKEEKLITNARNLESVDVFEPTFEGIQFMMSRLPNLKEIIPRLQNIGRIEALDISTLHKAREKLNGASKVIIYLPEWIYLPTKWEFGHLDFSLVEIRRIGSLPMDPKIKSSDENEGSSLF